MYHVTKTTFKYLLLLLALIFSTNTHARTLIANIDIDHGNFQLVKAWVMDRTLNIQPEVATLNNYLEIMVLDEDGNVIHRQEMDDIWRVPLSNHSHTDSTDTILLRLPFKPSMKTLEIWQRSTGSDTKKRVLIIDDWNSK